MPERGVVKGEPYCTKCPHIPFIGTHCCLDRGCKKQIDEANRRFKDKALFVWRLRQLREKWDAEDRKEIAEERGRYYQTNDPLEKEMIKNKLRILFGVDV